MHHSRLDRILIAAVAASGVLSLQSAHASASPTRGVGLLRLGSAWDKGTGYDRYSKVIVSEWVARGQRRSGHDAALHVGHERRLDL